MTDRQAVGHGQVALITGGAPGIGAATARRLAGHGRRVAVADIDTRTVEESGRLDTVVLNAAIAGRCGLDDITWPEIPLVSGGAAAGRGGAPGPNSARSPFGT
ncbi:SDR family NAD(P)-dependent oxidoreductase [Streptomyces sp. NPDC020883]|uniref:SDR family NAD(P)-dependent oxidoreductase n=1 Tax=Streptomyces sp. NPDC020883 TaxID=3365099 RepID=UPI0037999F38